MDPEDALKVAIREVTARHRALKRDIQADPRAELIRAVKLHELEQALIGLTYMSGLPRD